MALLPGSTEFPCAIHIQGPGDFNSPLTLYVEDGGVRAIVVTVHGHCPQQRDRTHAQISSPSFFPG